MIKIALIPAYEPDDKLILLVKELKKNNYEIIVVNDGSGEKYNDIFKQIDKFCTLISYENNMGKGYALKKGISFIKNNYSNYIVITMDCDGQHKVEDANKLFDYNKDNLETLVLGKRIRDKNVPLRSKLGNSITRFVYKLVTKNDIYDTQTGLRSFSYKLTDYMLSLEGNRYEYEMNMLLKLKEYNIPIKEINITTIYFDNNSNTHFKTIRDSFLVYKQIIEYSLSSFASFLLDYLLYFTFMIIFNNIILSNVFSRIISASFNYTINKKIVFNSNSNKSLMGYIILSSSILLLNTIILNILSNIFYMNAYLAKVLTECILFIVNYIIQKKYIFKKGEFNEK